MSCYDTFVITVYTIVWIVVIGVFKYMIFPREQVYYDQPIEACVSLFVTRL